MGNLTETAIFSQWFHNENIDNLHYSRWKTGKVDIVWLNIATQKPYWCVEMKWSDLPCTDARMLKGLVEFSNKNGLSDARVTTKTVTQEGTIDGVRVIFQPSASYTYMLGANILQYKSMTEILIETNE